MTVVLCVVFFLSGAAALIFETLWFHQAGLTLGNSIWASSLVLAGFMGGLAIGNGLIGRFGHRIRRPLRLYAILELIIGATGVGIVLLLPHLTPLLTPLVRPILHEPWILNPLRLAVAFPLLLLPATAMGATLPLLVAALFGRDQRFGRVLGRLYGWNTLGAVVGALAGEMALIEWFGIRGAALTAALLNLIAALITFGLSRALETHHAARLPSWTPTALSPRAVQLLLAAFLMGGTLLALEVVWFRFLLLFVYGTGLAFATMLSSVLAGIGLGGLLGAGWLTLRPDGYRALPALALGSGVASVLVYMAVEPVLRVTNASTLVRVYDVIPLAVTLMVPVSVLSGVLFTLLGEALKREIGGVTRSAGYLTLANTAGAMLGSLAAAFFLLPWLGMERSIHLLAGNYGLAAVLLIFGGVRPAARRGRFALLAAVGLFAIAYGMFPSGLLMQRYMLLRLQWYSTYEKGLPVEIREGLNETIIYLRRDRFGEPVDYRLFTNSHSMSSTRDSARRYMQLFVYLPVALHPAPTDALLISYGVGNTAKALTDTASLTAIDVVDTSREILEMSRIVFPDPAEHPLRDPRVRVHVEDGRYFLQTTDRRYDLITGEPPPPKNAGMVSLYTSDYFALIHDRLKEGGIATYWLPVHLLLESETRALIRGFCDVFQDCSLWNGSRMDWIIMGTRGAQGPVTEEQFTRQWRDPVVAAELRSVGLEKPEQLGALFLADAETLRELTRDTLPLTDEHPKRLSSEFMSSMLAKPIYQSWMRGDAAKRRFLESGFVKRHWPASMWNASAEYFDLQEVINLYYLDEFPRASVKLPVLHGLLTRSDVRTPVLWLLSSGEGDQRAAAAGAAKGWRGLYLHYHLGVGALADRDYARAQAHFREELAQREPGTGRAYLYYQLYAMSMAGSPGEAEALAAEAGLFRSGDEADQRAARFFSETFGWPAGDTIPISRVSPGEQ